MIKLRNVLLLAACSIPTTVCATTSGGYDSTTPELQIAVQGNEVLYLTQGNAKVDGNLAIVSSAAVGGNLTTVGNLTGSTAAFSGNVGIGNATTPASLNVDGVVSVSQPVTALDFIHMSDKRLKNNITPISNGLDSLLKIRGVSFNWKASGKKDMGVIAQEVEKVFPFVVSVRDDGKKAVEYDSLIAPVIEAIRELKQQNDALRQRLEKIEAQGRGVSTP